MKKTLLIAVILFISFSNFIAQDATLSIPDLVEIRGTEVLVPIEITPTLSPVRKVEVKIKYDSSVMRFTKETRNSILPGLIEGNKGDSIAIIIWTSITPVDLNGKIVDLVFDYIGGSSNIEFTTVSITQNPGQPFDIGIINGSISEGNNEAPSFGKVLPDTTIAETEVLTYIYTGTDPDGDELTFSIDSGPDSSTMDASGNFSWTPTFTQAGVYDIIVSLTDGVETVYDTSKVTVTETNRAPSFTNTLPDTTILEMETLTYLYTGVDPDGDALTFLIVSGPDGLTMDIDGNFSWTPTYDQAGVYDAVVAGLSDGVISVYDTTQITVTKANRAPSFVNTLPDTTIFEMEALTYLYTGIDPDGDALTFSLETGLTGAVINAAGNFSWTPDKGETGVYDLVVAGLSDGQIMVYDTTSITVVVENTSPYFTATMPDTTVTEKILLSFQYEGDDPDGDALSFALQSGPEGATISGSGTFYWTPATPDDIVATIIVSLTDQVATVYDTAEVSVLTDIDDITSNIPEEFSLGQNYPNPFNPSTTISYSVPESAMVNLTVYDITGQKIETLLNSEISAGFHRLSFDASKLAGGVYLYRIMATNSSGLNFVNTKKMLLIK